MIPSTIERVPEHTAKHVNERIRHRTEQNIAKYAAAGPQAIEQRLTELAREWDIERTLEANASIACLIGLTLGATVHPLWFIFPGVVVGFLLLHAVQGWCPPLPVFRRWHFRTAAEIDEERYALKLLRGDFRDLRDEIVNEQMVRQVATAVRR